eukprot:s1829_g8.t1
MQSVECKDALMKGFWSFRVWHCRSVAGIHRFVYLQVGRAVLCGRSSQMGCASSTNVGSKYESPTLNAEVEAKKKEAEASFNLEEPHQLAAYLKYANICLLRVEYLYELLHQERLLPRRQEAEEWGLVSHEELSEWAAGTRDAMLISVSHAWETREHPDPCGDQLKRLVSCLSIYDAAYSSKIWVFYDFVSLFQYQQTTKQKQSFDRSMDHMHMLYAHECNWTLRLEALTPDDVWNAALQNSKHLVMVYDDESKTVRGHPLKELVHNRVPYRDRGWCKAEVEWSSCRSRSEQNQQIDASGSEVSSEKELKGKVPMAPEVFQEDMKKAAFTHRKKDAAAVLKLQQDIYYEKVSACEEALLANLPEGELGRLAKALKDYKKLKVLRLRKIEVGEAEAKEFGKALALNDTITELEIKVAEPHRRDGYLALWKALADGLKSNRTVTHIDLGYNRIGVEGAKALADGLKSNRTVTHIDLKINEIRDDGAKALADALRSNRTVTHINLEINVIREEGFKALIDALKFNNTVTHIGICENFYIEDKGAKALADALRNLYGNKIEGAKDIEEAADARKFQAWTGKMRSQALASILTTNSSTARLKLAGQASTAEDCQALADALKFNRTVTQVEFYHTNIGEEGAKALADALKSNRTVTKINLCENKIGDDGAKALADALKSNCTVTHIDLKFNQIGDEGAKALADALRSNCTVTHISLEDNAIGEEGAKALADGLKSNCTVTRIDLGANNIRREGAKALADALKSNRTVTHIDLLQSFIGDEGAKALADALKSNCTVLKPGTRRCPEVQPYCAKALADAFGLLENSTIEDKDAEALLADVRKSSRTVFFG